MKQKTPTMPRLTSRTCFRPYFPQSSALTASLPEHGPVTVGFSWAARHEVTSRANERDVQTNSSSYVGQARMFNNDNMLGAPRMTFASAGHYRRWRENMSVVETDNPEHGDLWGEIPQWMEDMAMEDEMSRRN